MAEICNDNRFELIEEFKKKLIESTNIETSQEEMKVIDNILFRFWQMGWLESIDRMPLVKESAKTLIRSVGDSVSAKAFRNAGRFMQNAIDGEAQEYEFVQASSEIPNNSDAISRQDAIDEIDEWIKAFRENGHKESAADACLIQDGIIQLPSAQPKIIRCKDCKYAAPNGVYGCRLERFSCSDDSVRMYGEDFCSRAERKDNDS